MCEVSNFMRASMIKKIINKKGKGLWNRWRLRPMYATCSIHYEVLLVPSWRSAAGVKLILSGVASIDSSGAMYSLVVEKIKLFSPYPRSWSSTFLLKLSATGLDASSITKQNRESTRLYISSRVRLVFENITYWTKIRSPSPSKNHQEAKEGHMTR